MTDLEAIAKDAAERVHKNGGCVPQMAFAPILFALQDALSTTPAADADRVRVAGQALADALLGYGFPVSSAARPALTDHGSDKAFALDEAATAFLAALKAEVK